MPGTFVGLYTNAGLLLVLGLGKGNLCQMMAIMLKSRTSMRDFFMFCHLEVSTFACRISLVCGIRSLMVVLVGIGGIECGNELPLQSCVPWVSPKQDMHVGEIIGI